LSGGSVPRAVPKLSYHPWGPKKKRGVSEEDTHAGGAGGEGYEN